MLNGINVAIKVVSDQIPKNSPAKNLVDCSLANFVVVQTNQLRKKKKRCRATQKTITCGLVSLTSLMANATAAMKT